MEGNYTLGAFAKKAGRRRRDNESQMQFQCSFHAVSTGRLVVTVLFEQPLLKGIHRLDNQLCIAYISFLHLDV